MCLNQDGLKTFDQARVYKKPRVGYKVVIKTSDSEWRTSPYDFPLKLGKWIEDPKKHTLKACDNAVSDWSDLEYKTGFHIFPRLRDALLWGTSWEQIIRVEYNYVVARGFLCYHNLLVVVARKIRLVKVLQHE